MALFIIIASIFYSIPGSNQSDLQFQAYYQESSPQNNWILLTDTASIKWKGHYWVKVLFERPVDGNYTLQAGTWYMQYVRFYDGKKQLLSRGNFIKLPKGIDEIYLFYPFMDEKSQHGINLKLFPEKEFIELSSSENIFQSAFLSIIGFLAFVSLIFSLGSKDKVYLHYTLYLFSILYFFAYQYGILGRAVPIVNAIPPTWWWISSATLTIFYILFAMSFLDLKTTDRIAYRIMFYGLYFVMWVVVTEIISYLVNFNIQHSVVYKGFIVSVQLTLMVILLIRIFRIKTQVSRVFLFGMAVLVTTTLVGQVVSTFSLVDESNHVVQGGLLLDVFIFTIAMAVRTSQVYKDRQMAQERLIEQLQLNEKLQKVYTDQLEEKVLQRTAQLETRNKENETLLKEVHHRVKNNIQMISSLIAMQQRRLDDPIGKDALNITRTRVNSIGLIHEHLYRYKSLSEMDFERYLRDLVDMLIGSLHTGETITLDMDVDQAMVEVETALQIGIILNELITNCIKYAFPDHPNPSLKVTLQEKENALFVQVKDNGDKKGEIKNGFGWMIIKSTLDSLKGSFHRYYEDGLVCELVIHKYHIKQVVS